VASDVEGSNKSRAPPKKYCWYLEMTVSEEIANRAFHAFVSALRMLVNPQPDILEQGGTTLSGAKSNKPGKMVVDNPAALPARDL
jgi:hypothetical protein